MPASRVYRTEAIVLKAFDYGEADRILTLLTPQTGKLRAIAKGVRKTKSRKAGHLDLLTHSNLLLARGRQLDVVTQAETIETFAAIRTDLWRSSHAHYVSELLDSFSAENLANQPLYALALTTLRRLAETRDVDLAVRSFELQLLGLTGYRPQLYRCLHCDATIQPVVNHFSPKLGGILCPGCAAVDAAAAAISVPALKAMRNLQTNEQQMMRVGSLDAAVGSEIEQRLQEYISYQLEKRPRSIAFLDRLRREGVGATAGNP